jgi:molybdopterin-guanine dinucleotide biosynthesis protein A
MNPDIPWCGLVLAGGRSLRMGRDKASLVHPDGRALARRCHDLLREAGCGHVAISLRHEQDIPRGFEDVAGLEIIRDPAGVSVGPLAGILAAMRSRPASGWLVVACDLPRLEVPTLEHLMASRRPEDDFLAYRSSFDHLPEPLCAWYAASSRPVMEQALADDFRCPRKILIRHHARLLDPLVADALDNANTPVDWDNATRG